MAKFTLQMGEEIELMTAAEFAQIIQRERANWIARGTGVKWSETFQPVNASTFQDNAGPASGFAWKLRTISCVLSAAGTIAVFKGESVAGRPIATAQSVSAAGLNIAGVFFPDDIVVQSDQQIFVSAGAGTITAYYRGAVQFPAERLGEILS